MRFRDFKTKTKNSIYMIQLPQRIYLYCTKANIIGICRTFFHKNKNALLIGNNIIIQDVATSQEVGSDEMKGLTSTRIV